MNLDDIAFDPIVTEVNSLTEAFALAEKWKAEGKYHLFRGQAQNWEVVSSLHRLNETQYLAARDRITMLYHFASENKVLQKHLSKVDELFAIAQHYGLPTNYIDFTTVPEVAGYFATHSAANQPGQQACIICVNSQDFASLVEFAESYFKKILKANELRPCFLSVSVANLWRLEAQHGQFLYTPFKGIENFYQFNRILFPYQEPSNAIQDNEIYPDKKSVLEMNLDHYFEAERRSNNITFIESLLAAQQIKILPETDMYEYVSKGMPRHRSWQSKKIKNWLESSPETWSSFNRKHMVTLDIRLSDIRALNINNYITQLTDAINTLSENRNEAFSIHVTRNKIPFAKKLQQQIDFGCNLIWDGMRLLPYSSKQIATAIIRFVFMAAIHYKNPIYDFNPLVPSKVLVEMTNGDGARGRAHVCGYGILWAKRNSIAKYIKEGLEEDIDSNPVALVQLIYHPQYLFRFEKLCELFSKDVIPSQMVLELDAEHPTVYFNPAHLKVFGLA
ncbi:FRG domain-containing protein [Pedobacter ghigonis]|uniref:FRG domain-containing protein n=1 Tax=Pedobacter ghigonis TaxID=2730403 RepID=UPI00158B797B|nr:FRG domain-containing protein [Pedobacter ghigonis]